MPSSKYIDKSEDYVPEYKPQLIPKVNRYKNVVSFDQWYDQNYDHLDNIYRMLQEACHSTGRQVFDSETCNFDSFCRIAYENSFKYKKHDPNYSSEPMDEEHVIFTS